MSRFFLYTPTSLRWLNDRRNTRKNSCDTEGDTVGKKISSYVIQSLIYFFILIFLEKFFPCSYTSVPRLTSPLSILSWHNYIRFYVCPVTSSTINITCHLINNISPYHILSTISTIKCWGWFSASPMFTLEIKHQIWRSWTYESG